MGLRFQNGQAFSEVRSLRALSITSKTVTFGGKNVDLSPTHSSPMGSHHIFLRKVPPLFWVPPHHGKPSPVINNNGNNKTPDLSPGCDRYHPPGPFAFPTILKIVSPGVRTKVVPAAFGTAHHGEEPFRAGRPLP